jgi:hypothetical protein
VARTGLLFTTLLIASATVCAFEQTLDPMRLAEAIYIGQSRIDDVRSRFHAAYHVDIAMAPVDYAEIVTPFRRIALEAEATTRAGARLYGQREALASLGDDPGRLDVVVELTFHPLNTYVGVPDFQIRLQPVATGMAIEPKQVSRVPRFGPRLAGSPLAFPYTAGASTTGVFTPPARGTAQPLLGGRLIANFDGGALMSGGTYWILISDAGKELARGRVDLTGLR